MPKNPIFNPSVINKICSAEKAEIIQPVTVGHTGAENELVFFIKPELLDISDDAKIANSLSLIEKKFKEYRVTISGAVIVPGAVLEEYEIMNHHYGFINQLSRMASTLIDAETRSAMFAKLGKQDSDTHQILGGHEFLTTFNSDLDTLSKVWFGKGAEKMRSGFYFVEESFQGQPILLVNGFHPSQLAHFTRPDHRIVLMLLHTDTDWDRMKFSLVGDTFPERAKPASIRGTLFADPDQYGQTDVGINLNGVHLSAGPYEAAFEVVNFFGNLLDLDPKQTPPAAIQRSIDFGVPQDLAHSLLDNPKVGESDLFSETENIDTKDAIHFVLDNLVY